MIAQRRRDTKASTLERIDRRWGALPEEVRAAILELIAEPYLRLAHPTDETFADACGVAPGTPAFAAAWAAEIARRQVSQAAAYGDDDRVYALCARDRDGRPVALATILTVYGARAAPLNDALGDPGSSLPTLRMLRFAIGPDAGLPATVPESRLAEFGRLCIRQPPDLARLVCAGVVTLAEAAYVEAHAFDELFAMAYWRDRAAPEPPLAYLGNTQPWLMAALERRGLDVRRLYLAAGAEPTPRVLGNGQSTATYFGRWPALLGPLVPAAILARGTAAAVRHLAHHGGPGWEDLSLSLPFWILNNAKTAGAMANLARDCGLTASPPGPAD